jgi:hypothetical protein
VCKFRKCKIGEYIKTEHCPNVRIASALLIRVSQVKNLISKIVLFTCYIYFCIKNNWAQIFGKFNKFSIDKKIWLQVFIRQGKLREI